MRLKHGLTTRDASMGTEAPTPVVIPVHCAYKKAPCPRCGKRGRRKRALTRTVRTVAFKAVAFLEITCGEYAARCRCCTSFRNSPEGVPPRAKYDDRVRGLVLDRLIKDGMSIERALDTRERGRRGGEKTTSSGARSEVKDLLTLGGGGC
jgi:hypothetical protein